MRVCAIQLAPGHDRAANVAEAARLMAAAYADQHPQLMALPEVWSCLGGPRSGKLSAAEDFANPDPDGPYAMLRGFAARHGMVVHGGSMLEHGPDGRLFNTTVVFGRDGGELARYRKIHLFDIVTPDGTGYRESATFAPGESVVTAGLGTATLGLAICYDLRFPTLFSRLRQAGTDIVALPAAFTTPTGRAHWEVLLRARAIETQCWIVAPATCGSHAGPDGAPRTTFGHSMIVDPWGTVVARLDDAPGWCGADLDLAISARIRRDMPILEHDELGRR